MADETKPTTLEARHASLEDECPEIYVNGMEIGMSLSDISVTVSVGGNRKIKLYMSFTTAKTFADNLSQAVTVLEQKTKRRIMSMEEVEAGLRPDRE